MKTKKNKKKREENGITCLQSAVLCSQFIVAILSHVFVSKGLQKYEHETALLVRSLRFPCRVVPDFEGVQHDILQTWQLIMNISSYHDLQKMKILRTSGQSEHEGGKVVSPTHRPSLPPRKYPWYSFLSESESTPGP
jgi:hypothetical protein